MVAIILTGLQILLLMLKAHFAKDDDRELALKHLAEAQAKLDAVASQFEEKLRYSSIDPVKMDQFQDAIEREEYNARHPNQPKAP